MSRSPLFRGVLACTAAALITIMFTAAYSDAPPSPAEKSIKYRQSVYKVILWNLGPLGAMVQGKMPYDATAFARHAERISVMAPMLLEGYGPDTASAPGVKTRAKPEIWANMDEFTKLMHAMESKAAAFATVAKGGDLEKSKAAFGELTDACKACHDKYRSD